jgi:hypothetical protein
MSDYASASIEQIRKLGFKPGTRLNIFCSSCLESIKVFSDKLDREEMQKYLGNHRRHEGCFFGFSDGRRWKIQNDGGIEANEPQRIEPTIETTTPGEPPSKPNPEPHKEEDVVSECGFIEGDTIEDYTWIKLYRKLRKNPIYKDSIAVHLFIHLLLTANHKPNRFIFNEKEIMVKRGQLITGRKQLSSYTGINESTVKRRLKLFEKIGILTTKTTNKFSIITICNYKHYQGSISENWPANRTTANESQVTIKRPATGQQLTTNKNVRNQTLYVEGSDPLRLATLLLEEIRKNKSNFKGPNLQAWARDIDLMLRIDNRSAEVVEKVIRWVQTDHGDRTGRWKGWAANILSPGKLREKFDELELKMQATNGRKSKSW